MIRIFSYIFFMRPVLFFPAWSTLLILSQTLGVAVPVKVFIATGFLMGACFILNQISDIESDKLNNKCLFIEKEHFTQKQSFIYAIFLLTTSLITLYHLNFFKFYIGVAFYVIAGYLYNFKPFALKQSVFGGVLSNWFMGFSISLIIFDNFNIPFSEVFILSLFNFAIYLLTTLPDIEGDLATSKHTVGNRIGIKKTLYLGIFISVVSAALATNVENNIYMFLALIQLITIFSQLLIKNNHIISIIKLLLLIQAMIAVIYYPIYLLPIMLVYIGGRAYYKSQFKMEYPSLKNE